MDTTSPAVPTSDDIAKSIQLQVCQNLKASADYLTLQAAVVVFSPDAKSWIYNTLIDLATKFAPE